MLPYTICFIRQGTRVLLLNREKAPWMGCWNGVGGKLLPGESPKASVLREVLEETGIRLEGAAWKGIVTWRVDGEDRGGMHAFVAELSEGHVLPTPLSVAEGILDWKELDWIMHPDNQGIASNLPHFLIRLLDDPNPYEHRCLFENGRLVAVEARKLEKGEIELEIVHR